MSALRIFGLLLGVLTLFLAFRSSRSYKRYIAPLPLFFTGLGLVFVTVFPETLNRLAELFAFDTENYGRIILVIIISVIALWFITLRTENALSGMQEQSEKLVRNLAAHFSRQDGIARGKIWVLIPAFNEKDNLAHVLPEIPKTIDGHEIQVAVIDDGSQDGTAEMVESCGALVVPHMVNIGGGAALKTGYLVALAHGPAAIVTMDADGQHRPADLPVLLSEILDGKADLVIGSRAIGSSADYSRLRSAGVVVFSKLINVLAGTSITDCASGFRAFSGRFLETCRLEQTQYHTSEAIIEASKHGLKIIEVPIRIEARHSGESKKGANLFYAYRFFKVIVSTWMR
jgi:hypothetical protein